MKKMRILIFLLLLVLAASAGLAYVNAVLLPAVAKDKIAATLSNITQGPVTLESVRINLLRGIIVNNLILYDKDEPQKQLCSVREASASLLLFPLIKEKKIIIPGVRLHKVALRFVRRPDGSWNTTRLLENRFKATAGPFTPLIKDFSIRDISVVYEDNAALKPRTFTLHMDSIAAKTSIDKIMVEGHGELMRETQTIPFSVRGDYAFADKAINARLTTPSLDTKFASGYLGQLPFTLESGTLTQLEGNFALRGNAVALKMRFDLTGFNAAQDALTIKDGIGHAAINIETTRDNPDHFAVDATLDIANASISYKKDKIAGQTTLEKTQLVITCNKETLVVKGSLNIKDTSLEAQGATVSGLNAQTNFSLNQNSAHPTLPNFEGSGKVLSGAADGIPRIQKLTGLTASFFFNDEAVTVESFTAGVFNTVVTGKGRYAGSAIDADIEGEFDLADLEKLLPASMPLPAHKISGAAAIKAHATIPVPLPSSMPSISGEALIKDVWLDLTDTPMTTTADKGRLTFDLAQENLEWHADAIVVNNDKTYSCDGTLKGFQAPEISMMLIGPDFKINAQFTKTDDKLNFTSFKGRLKKTQADLTGSMDLDTQTADATGAVILDLADIPLPDLGLKGQCSLDVQGRGPLKNFRQWRLKAAGHSDLVQSHALKIKNASVDYDQANGIGIISNLSFEAYGGQALVKGRFDFSKDRVIYAVRGVVENLDLGALKLDTPMKNKTYYGILGLKIAVQGLGSDRKNLKGGGSLSIKNGNIWELNPLQKLGTFLFAPRFESIVFTAARGDFFIQDDAVSTNNLDLMGPEMNLLIEGDVGFDGTLNLLVNSQVPLPGVPEALAKAGGLTAIEVKGNVKNPKYNLLPLKANIFKKFNDVVSSILP